MGRARDQFVEHYGGRRPGETEVQLKSRMDEIDRLDALFKSGLARGDEIEKTQRRLCELRGLDFDADDEDDSWESD